MSVERNLTEESTLRPEHYPNGIVLSEYTENDYFDRSFESPIRVIRGRLCRIARVEQGDVWIEPEQFCILHPKESLGEYKFWRCIDSSEEGQKDRVIIQCGERFFSIEKRYAYDSVLRKSGVALAIFGTMAVMLYAAFVSLETVKKMQLNAEVRQLEKGEEQSED